MLLKGGVDVVIKISKKISFLLALCLSVAAIFGFFSGVRSFIEYLFPKKYESIVNEASATYNVEKETIYAIIKCESGFDSDAHSHAGAQGLMQITPDTFKWLQLRTKDKNTDIKRLKNPYVNIMYGTFFISFLRKKYGNEEVVLSAYNAGEATVKRWLDDKGISKNGKTLDNIPYKETRRYVKRVQLIKKIYKMLYFS